MSIGWKSWVIVLTVLFTLQVVLLLSIVGFEWQYPSEDKIVVIDAISVQIAILETLLAVAGIAFAIAGVVGYQGIKEGINTRIKSIAEEQVNNVLNARGITSTQEHESESTDQIPTSKKRTATREDDLEQENE